MDDLSDYRREIDEIDAKMIPLLERRMDMVRKVGQYKKEHHLPVLQAGREQEVLEKAVSRLQNPDYAEAARRFMNTAMEVSRAAQRRDLGAPVPAAAPPAAARGGRVGFPGVPGSFSEQAAIDFFTRERERAAYPEFSDVCAALRAGEIDYGVLPIENSSTGAVAEVYDLLARYGFYIVGERRQRVSHNLVAPPGATLDGIREVYSHEQGLSQCGGFLARHPDWTRIPHHNTATSAKLVADAGDLSKAAIASSRAAELYGLQILARDVQDSRENTTRFIIIGRELEQRDGDKVSLVFALDNESGTLYRTLRYFARHRINLVKIESRPIPGVLWNYLFYLDFEGDLDNAEVREVLDAIARGARDFRVLGAYRADRDG